MKLLKYNVYSYKGKMKDNENDISKKSKLFSKNVRFLTRQTKTFNNIQALS